MLYVCIKPILSMYVCMCVLTPLSSQLTLGCTMSPNAETVVTASEDNEVMIFDYKDPQVAQTGRPLLKSVLTGHVSPVGCIACNPKYDVMATGCVNTVLWIPKTA